MFICGPRRAVAGVKRGELFNRYIEEGKNKKVLVYLRRGYDLRDHSTYVTEQPLSLAARHGNFETLALLLSYDADANEVDENGQSPLLTCALYGRHVCAALLIEAGALVNQHDLTGRTAAHYATCFRNRRVLDILIQHGADLNLSDHRGFACLHIACEIRCSEMIRLLIYHGGILNVRHYRKYYSDLTPIFYLVLNGDFDNLRYLMLAGYSLLVADWSNLKYNSRFLQYFKRDKLAFDWFVQQLVQPRTLKSICRERIRLTLGVRLVKKIDRLPVPLPVRAYLRLDILE